MKKWKNKHGKQDKIACGNVLTNSTNSNGVMFNN